MDENLPAASKAARTKNTFMLGVSNYCGGESIHFTLYIGLK